MRGIIIEGTGLGHVSDLVVSKISRLVKRGIFVGMTSQCIWGRVDPECICDWCGFPSGRSRSIRKHAGGNRFCKTFVGLR